MNVLLRQKLESRLDRVGILLDLAYAALEGSAGGEGISSFELDTGEADQKVIFKSEAALLRFIDTLEAKQEQICRRLGGNTFVTVKVRRKP